MEKKAILDTDLTKSVLKSAYDLSSIGIGVQRQLVDYIVRIPDEIRNRKYLSEALQSGTQSNLLSLGLPEETLLLEGVQRVKISLKGLKEAYRSFEAGLWRSLVYGTEYSGPRNPFEIQEAREIFRELVKKGYFSGTPSKEAFEIFLAAGYNNMKFSRAVMNEGIDFDYNRISKDMEDIILKPKRKDSAGFHSSKLDCMTIVIEEALKVLPEMEFYRNDNPRWKELFYEDVPTVRVLTDSAKEVSEEGKAFAVS